MIELNLNVNGQKKKVRTYSMKRLLDVLREDLALTGSKEGCGEGECGACSVLIDGKLVNSCLVPAIQADGKEVLTIEGITNEKLKKLHPIQECFISSGGAQCGICTPGMIMAAYFFIEQKKKEKKKATLDEIKEALAGNLCRCTGYTKIFDSVKQACKQMGVRT